jgi:hypothetical protein
MNNGIAELPTFPSDIYHRIALNDLVVYAVYFLSSREKEIVFEDVVAIAFRLFTERFHLRGYIEWPDSTVVNKRWLDCRAKGLLQGSTRRDGLGAASRSIRRLRSSEATSELQDSQTRVALI